MPLNLIFIQPGNYTIDDNGVPGDNISVIRDGNGVVIFTFGHPVDGLGFTASTPGVNLTVNFTDSMNAANFSVGSLTNPAESLDSIVMKNIVTTGTVTLVANNSITEGGADSGIDIRAGAVILSAVNGIGTAGNAIETRTGLFEAETTTGGVSIRNIGAVQIGGISPDVDGLDVATSGDISFINTGSIFLTEANTVTAAEVVHGGGTSGNVTLVASGVNADIIGNVDNGAVSVPRGFALLSAGRDIQLGTIGADFNNDVITNNALTLLAGRDILIDGFADILSDNFGLDTGGDLVFSAGRNIGILNLAGTSASVTASGSGGGNATVTTGVGGSLTVNGPGSFGLGSTSGDVVVNADRILIDGGSGISAPSGEIFLRPRTDGRAVFLGSASDASLALELSDLELNRLFAPRLTLGSDLSGTVRVIAPVAPISAGNAPDVTLRSGQDILVESNITTTTSLELRAGDDVQVTGVAVITTGSFSAFVDNLGDDENTGGLGTLIGTVSATPVSVTGNADADLLTGTNGNDALGGLGGADILRGRSGNDVLNGGTGIDQLEGGLGDDQLFVDSNSDVILEAVGEGTDRIFASAGYVLQAGVSVETLSTTNNGGTAAINLTGNELENTIFGNNGVNVLNGAGGNDILSGFGGIDNMTGGSGNDQFFVDVAGDVVQEAVGEGTDRVFASATYTLGAGVEVETLSTDNDSGTAAINLVGNNLGNILIGNNGNNILNGATGNDTLQGLSGNDSLYVDSASDVVVEGAAGGTDRVFASVSYALGGGAEVETLSTTNNAGVTAINLLGNGFANNVIGNAGANVLNGAGGNDTMQGLGGADSFGFTSALGPGNVDVVADFAPGVDEILVDNAVFTGLAAGALAAGAFRSGAAAADADDRIIYNPATGALFFDVDGNGATAQVQFATLSTGLTVTFADFTVI